MRLNKLYRKGIPVTLALMSMVSSAQAQRTVPVAYPLGTPVSFVRTWELTAPVIDGNAVDNKPLRDAKMATTYVDGLGRPLQTVIRQGALPTKSGEATDIVSPVEYDEFGREQFKYLPYAEASASDGAFKTNPFSAQAAFMTQQYGPQGETWFYSHNDFELSPQDKVKKAMAAGDNWVGAGRGVEARYWSNTVTDNVKIWTVTDIIGSFGNYQVSGIYPAGQLFKNIIIDEHGKQVIEFKDKEGKPVLKKVQLTAGDDTGTGSGYEGWLNTYYIYDDFNLLRAIIQPEGVEGLLSSWTLNSTLLNEQCFRYEYDQRGRVIKKKVPGAGEVYMVYDNRDRLVLTQDANMRQQQQWMYTTYDALNRPVATGLISDNNTHAYHLASALGSSSYPNLGAYTPEELTRTFYDDYSWLGSYGNPLSATYNNSYDSYFQTASNSVWPYPQANVQSNQLKGMATGSRTKVLGTASTYLYTLTIYDAKGKPIQVQSTNITGGTDIGTTQYSWAGQPLVVIQKQQKADGTSQTHITITRMSYDDLGRVSNIKKEIAGTLASKAEKIIAEMEYDALGQLVSKRLGNKMPADEPVETLVYDYNIRGWMLGMNRDYLTGTGQSGSSLFGFELGYDKTTNNSGKSFTTGIYNGNITGIVWKSDGDDVRRKYDFTYDAANRLMKGDFEQDDANNSWSATTMNYSMQMGNGTDPATAYDANGNIQKMKQFGWKLGATGATVIDDLTYTYYAGTNKLKNVFDAQNDPQTKLGDFRFTSGHPQYSTKQANASPATVTDYTYDANGNMVNDYNKNIKSGNGDGILYNHLNLPAQITVKNDNGTDKGTITYTYDAAGNKLKKTVAETGQPAKTTLYLGGAVYENDVLQFLSQEEGRIRFKPVQGLTPASFEYDYFIKDHLGNVRMVLTEEYKQDKYPVASLEPSKIGIEKDYYDIQDAQVVNKSEATGIPDYVNDNGIGNNPTDGPFSATNSTKLYKLNSSTTPKTGLGITLKVMAGDRIDVFGKSYYFNSDPNPPSSGTIPILDLLAGFLGNPMAGAATAAHAGVTPAIINTTVNMAGMGSMISQQNTEVNGGTKPRAFINVIFFDEQFKVPNDGTGFKISMVGNFNTIKDHYTDLQNLVARKNGFVYIYVSNESAVNVFFDNLQVVHTKSSILEETHYYPYGLVMSGISSKAASIFPNEEKTFQGQRIDHDLDLNWVQFKWRNHDPQIGRFIEIDPLSEKYEYNSTYAFSENKVISHVELEGLEAEPVNEGGGFWSGVWSGIKEKASNVGHAVMNPVKTVKSAFTPSNYFRNQLNIVTFGAVDLWDDVNTVNSEGVKGFGKVVGGKLFDATMLFAPAAIFKGVQGLRSTVSRASLITSEAQLSTAGKNIFNFLEGNNSFKNSFTDGNYQMMTASSDMTVYRVYGGSTMQGSFFSTVKPTTSAQAESMLNINKYGNTGTHVVPVTIKAGTQFAYGNVAGGTGTQIFVQGQEKNLIYQTKKIQELK